MQPIFGRAKNVETSLTEFSNLYLDPPKDKLRLDELENLVADRRNFVKKFEALMLKSQKNSPEYEAEVTNMIREYDRSLQARYGTESRKYDAIAHFLIRLAVAKMSNYKSWFISVECEIFKYRLKRDSLDTLQKLLNFTKIKYEMVNDIENQKDHETKSARFKIEFEYVPELVSTRQVFLNKGFVYLTADLLRPLILQYFKSQLSEQIEQLSRNMDMIEEDQRLMSSLKKIFSYTENQNFNYKNFTCDKVDLNNIDFMSEQSFPPCMLSAHNFLKQNGHLKYRGRIQYGLFLKGLGLSLEESLAFWRSHFHSIPAEKFDKLYSYYIRYNYGQEGKRVDFNPSSCIKIITSDQMTAGETHGCPFKQYDTQNLENMLRHKNIDPTNSEIIELAANKHYQLACSRFFEIVHKQPKGTATINHPNEYFQMSRTIYQNVQPDS